MLTMNSADVRREWSGVMDTVVRRKPVFVKRTRDVMMLADTELIARLVSGLRYTADRYVEEDGAVTLSLRDMDIAVSAPDEAAARRALAADILEYAEEYYQNFELYSRAPNRAAHLPWVIKALTARSLEDLEGAVVCQAGET